MKRNSLCKKAFMAAAVLSAAMLLSVPAERVSAKGQTNDVVLGAEQTLEAENDLKAANSFSNKQCGEDVYATLANGTLTISGTGDMWKAAQYGSNSVFSDDQASIREVVIKDGVTNVGAYVFYGFSQLEKVTLADSVETIGAGAFYNTGIRRLVCPKNLKSIEGTHGDRGAF